MIDKKIVFFTGAGVSAESGVDTFRGGDNPLWDGVNVQQVATPEGWRADKELVLGFYNSRRKELPTVVPNLAHLSIAEAEGLFKEVTVITQNVDDLHERGGSTNIMHLHGELLKSRSSVDDNLIYDRADDVLIGDKCAKGSQLRPHVVWFGEYPFMIPEAMKALAEADYVVVVGTSLQIGYTIPMIGEGVSDDAVVYYVDPEAKTYLDKYGCNVKYILEPATKGVPFVVADIIERNSEE